MRNVLLILRGQQRQPKHFHKLQIARKLAPIVMMEMIPANIFVVVVEVVPIAGGRMGKPEIQRETASTHITYLRRMLIPATLTICRLYKCCRKIIGRP